MYHKLIENLRELADSCKMAPRTEILVNQSANKIEELNEIISILQTEKQIKNTKNISETIFLGQHARFTLDDKLYKAGVPDTFRLEFDEYDYSVELHELPPEYRLSIEVQKIIQQSGFQKAYCNHTDNWETHYEFNPSEDFVESKPWRVSYPHKREDGTIKILVEEKVLTWPEEWFDTGYCVIKPSEKNNI